MAELTLESAKAYVVAHYAAHSPSLAPDIEGCGIVTQDGIELCKLNVTIGGEAHQWDVWSEPCMEGALYGEF